MVAPLSPLPSPPPLATVALLFQSKPEYSALPHVIDSVSEFLDSAVEMPFWTACKFNSIRLLERIWNSCRSESEPSPSDAGPGHGGTFSRRQYLRSDRHYNLYCFQRGLDQAAELPGTEVVKWLFDHFYGGTASSTAVQNAAKNGNLELLQFLKKNAIRGTSEHSLDIRHKVELTLQKKHFVMWGYYDLGYAAKGGHHEIMWWLHNNVPALRVFKPVVEAMAESGDAMMLEWTLLHYRIRRGDKKKLMEIVAKSGRVDIMEWLYKNRYTQEMDNVYDDDSDELGFLVSEAVESGSLDMVTWLIKHNFVEAGCVLDKASRLGKLEMTKGIYNSYSVNGEFPGQAQYIGYSTMLYAAMSGSLDTVKWLFSMFRNDPDIDLFRANESENEQYNLGAFDQIMDEVAGWGHLDVLKYLHELDTSLYRDNSNGPRCSTAAMDGAAREGFLEVVQWLHNNRTEGCTTDAMNLASGHGHLETLKWLHVNRKEGCTTRAMDLAASDGHLDVLKWLHLHRAEGCTSVAIDNAARNGHVEVVKYLHALGMYCSSGVANAAASSGHLSVVKYLHEQQMGGFTTDAMDEAARRGKLAVVKWLHEHRNEGCTTKALDNAVSSHCFDVLLFLHSQYSKRSCSRVLYHGDISPEGSEADHIGEWVAEHYPRGSYVSDNSIWPDFDPDRRIRL